jgi:hypothetical protein
MRGIAEAMLLLVIVVRFAWRGRTHDPTVSTRVAL